MRIFDAAPPALFFIVSVFSIAQSGIAIQAYTSTGKAKDTSFKFSVAMLVLSILSMFLSILFVYRAWNGVTLATSVPGAYISSGIQARYGTPDQQTVALKSQIDGLQARIDALSTPLPPVA